ncbi:MAG: 50S ribosomal protein L10, partial [Nitrospirota bacterium]|nr:50S ribosomal protein L10 [Nitrospirota bacterium]
MEAKSTKQEKIKVVQELHEKFGKAGAVILTDYKGLTVAQLTELRNRLRKCGAEYRVVKNTLAKRASEGTDAYKLEGYFSGTTGVVISYDDVVTPAKVLLEYAVKLEPFKIR